MKEHETLLKAHKELQVECRVLRETLNALRSEEFDKENQMNESRCVTQEFIQENRHLREKIDDLN